MGRRHVRYGALLVALGLTVIFSTGCPLTTFYVTYPTNSQHFTVDAGDHLVMTVRFSRDVDLSTLKAGSNVTVDTDTTTNAAITIVAGATANEIVITTTDTVANLLVFDSDGFFTLKIFGTADIPNKITAVTDTGGLALDGDKNDVDGGNWWNEYFLLG